MLHPQNMSSLVLFLGFLSLVVGQANLLYDPAKYPNLPSYGPQVIERLLPSLSSVQPS